MAGPEEEPFEPEEVPQKADAMPSDDVSITVFLGEGARRRKEQE